MVTMIVKVDPGPEVRISTSPPSFDTPIATGASAYVDERNLRTVSRLSQEDFDGSSAIPTGDETSEIPNVINAAQRFNIVISVCRPWSQAVIYS